MNSILKKRLRKFLAYKKENFLSVKEMYSIIFDKKALDFLNKLEKEIKERIWKKLQKCKENPFRFLEHLEEIDGFKLRVGDYRLIIDVNKITQTIYILKAGHRKNIYEH